MDPTCVTITCTAAAALAPRKSNSKCNSQHVVDAYLQVCTNTDEISHQGNANVRVHGNMERR